MTGAGGRLLRCVSISPDVYTNNRPCVICYSRLAPELCTSINSAAQFHVAGCSASAAQASVKPILCCFCASASPVRGGVGLLGGGRILAFLPVVKTTMCSWFHRPLWEEGGSDDPTEDAAIKNSTLLAQCCWMKTGGR